MDANPTIASEQRLVPRFPGETVGPLQLSADPAGTTLTVNVRDISILGMGVVTRQTFPTGTFLRVKVGPGGAPLPDDLKAEVQHSTRLSAECYLVGCRFSRRLTVEDILAMG
jgi:hypothetical protein